MQHTQVCFSWMHAWLWGVGGFGWKLLFDCAGTIVATTRKANSFENCLYSGCVKSKWFDQWGCEKGAIDRPMFFIQNLHWLQCKNGSNFVFIAQFKNVYVYSMLGPLGLNIFLTHSLNGGFDWGGHVSVAACHVAPPFEQFLDNPGMDRVSSCQDDAWRNRTFWDTKPRHRTHWVTS